MVPSPRELGMPHIFARACRARGYVFIWGSRSPPPRRGRVGVGVKAGAAFPPTLFLPRQGGGTMWVKLSPAREG
jgi:hypothetical protein